MKNWEQMKDFSYVGIKLTKAKTISQGLTKCKIQKLTRQNPLYQHLKLHQLIDGRKPCHLCASLPNHHPNATHRSHTDLRKRGKTAPLIANPSTPLLSKQPRPLTQRAQPEESLQKKASIQFDRLQNVIKHFNTTLRRTHSQFGRMQKHSRLTTRYFLTEANELTQQLDQDRTEFVSQVKSMRMHLLQEQQARRREQRQVQKRVRQLNQPIQFPLGLEQMQAIVQQSKERQQDAGSKLNRMMCSLHEYKAKANYANKMKIIKQYNP